MKVKELLEKMNGVYSYGVYDRDGVTGDTQCSINSIMKYMEEEVDHFSVFTYDDTDYDIDGKKINVKRIRCCIYCSTKEFY